MWHAVQAIRLEHFFAKLEPGKNFKKSKKQLASVAGQSHNQV